VATARARRPLRRRARRRPRHRLGLGRPRRAERQAHQVATPAEQQGGRGPGTRAYIALSFDGKRLRIYVCDGHGRRVATISKWLTGRWDGGSPIMLVRDGVEVRIDQLHDDGRISGTVRAFSGPHPFTVEPATGPAGLYDGIDRTNKLRATWIVRPDRSIRGNIIPTRPPRRVCRMHTFILSDGTTTERVVCYDV
jgi:hypothetical protein